MHDKRVLILGFAHPEQNLRLAQQIEFLSNTCSVTAACFSPPSQENVEYLEITPPTKSFLSRALETRFLLNKNYEAYYWQMPEVQQALTVVEQGEWDLVLACGIETLPLASRIASSSPILFDAVKHLAGEKEEGAWSWSNFMQNFYCHLATHYLKYATCLMSGSCELAEDYTHAFDVTPHVIFTLPEAQDLTPQMHEDETIRLVYFGQAQPLTNLERFIDLFKLLDERFVLDFIFTKGSNPSYVKKIQQRAKRMPRIHFSSVDSFQVPLKQLNTYDLAISLTENSSESLSKLFACLQARIGMITPPFTDGNRLMIPYQLGLLIGDDHLQTIAYQINQLKKEQVAIYKRNAQRIAAEFVASKGSDGLLDVVQEVIAKKSHATKTA